MSVSGANTWLTADQHFGDDRFKIMQRPFDNNYEQACEIMKNHNKLVQPADEVIFNGDVVYKKEWFHFIGHLAGKKTLIRGNYDRQFSDAQFKKYFSKIVDEGDGLELEIDEVPMWVTHYPTRSRGDRFNLVSHVHNAWRVQKGCLNVGVDVNHFRPITLEDCLSAYKAICDVYDDDVWVAYAPQNEQFNGIRGKSGSRFPEVK